MAVIHIKNIHNHKIKTGFRNEPLPPYFDGYVDTLSGNIVDPVSNVDTFLQSVKDEVDDAVNRLAGFEDALSCTVTVSEVDKRLSEAETRISEKIPNLETSTSIASFKWVPTENSDVCNCYIETTATKDGFFYLRREGKIGLTKHNGSYYYDDTYVQNVSTGQLERGSWTCSCAYCNNWYPMGRCCDSSSSATSSSNCRTYNSCILVACIPVKKGDKIAFCTKVSLCNCCSDIGDEDNYLKYQVSIT